jgi:hypothetical protein
MWSDGQHFVKKKFFHGIFVKKFEYQFLIFIFKNGLLFSSGRNPAPQESELGQADGADPRHERALGVGQVLFLIFNLIFINFFHL